MIHNDKVLEDVNALLDYNSVKDFLFMNVINAETNKEELSMEPHTVIGDLAIVYRVMIKTTDDQFCSARVTNEMLDHYGIDVSQLHNDALISSPNMMKPEIIPLETLLMGVPEQEAWQNEDRHFVVLTNEHRTDGAATIFYSGVLNNLAEKLGHDLYIVPSSTDECLALCDSPTLNINRLKEMLLLMNGPNFMDQDKKLSDILYHYDKDNHVLEKSDDYEKRINKQKYSQLLH